LVIGDWRLVIGDWRVVTGEMEHGGGHVTAAVFAGACCL
jgi:hypothetical protein